MADDMVGEDLMVVQEEAIEMNDSLAPSGQLSGPHEDWPRSVCPTWTMGPSHDPTSPPTTSASAFEDIANRSRPYIDIGIGI